jgi:hypothetical protein
MTLADRIERFRHTVGEWLHCGRCAMSAVVGATTGDDRARDPEEGGEEGPYGGERIEVDERELRRVSPAAWIGAAVDRLDDLAARLTYGR